MKVLWLLGIDLDISLWILIPLTLFILHYIYMIWNNKVFKKLGIPGPKPTPYLGNLTLLIAKGWQFNDRKIHDEYGKYVGVFFGRYYMLMIYDVDIMKQILVKDFSNFDNRSNISNAAKPANRSLLELKGEEWRIVRNTLSPTFSSGKLKKMASAINECADQMVENIAECVNQHKTFDIQEMSGAFTMDVIARTGFGLEINSQKDKNSVFVQHAQAIFGRGIRTLFFIMSWLFPFAVKLLNRIGIVSSMPKKSTDFFYDVTEKTFVDRQQNKQKSIDFIQLMIDAHKDDTKPEDFADPNDRQKKKTLTKDDILANSLIFFLAGYETTANTLTFLLYLLAQNSDCQKRLMEEIDEALQGKEPTYDDLYRMPYLDQAVNETMRLYPQAPRAQRVAKEDTTIGDLYIPKDMPVVFPVYALHTDPEIWPDPLKFNPDRFSAEEKAQRDPYYFVPFGHGPRNCIGMRLALMELKIVVIRILQRYRLTTCSDTQNPIEIDAFRMRPKDGLKLKAERREHM